MHTTEDSDVTYRPSLAVNFWAFPDSPEGREVSSIVDGLAGAEEAGIADAGFAENRLILPFLTLCAASTLADESVGIRSEVLRGAAAVELLRSADHATRPRHDLLVARALRFASQLGAEAAALIAEVLEEHCVTEEYCVTNADGALFGGAARMGALLQGASERRQRAFEEFGRRLGTAFQIVEIDPATSDAADWSLSAMGVLYELDGLKPEPLALLERLANDVVHQLD